MAKRDGIAQRHQASPLGIKSTVRRKAKARSGLRDEVRVACRLGGGQQQPELRVVGHLADLAQVVLLELSADRHRIQRK
jgi:hypothetical protein